MALFTLGTRSQLITFAYIYIMDAWTEKCKTTKREEDEEVCE
jgi:hypothetical protein